MLICLFGIFEDVLDEMTVHELLLLLDVMPQQLLNDFDVAVLLSTWVMTDLIVLFGVHKEFFEFKFIHFKCFERLIVISVQYVIILRNAKLWSLLLNISLYKKPH